MESPGTRTVPRSRSICDSRNRAVSRVAPAESTPDRRAWIASHHRFANHHPEASPPNSSSRVWLKRQTGVLVVGVDPDLHGSVGCIDSVVHHDYRRMADPNPPPRCRHGVAHCACRPNPVYEGCRPLGRVVLADGHPARGRDPQTRSPPCFRDHDKPKTARERCLGDLVALHQPSLAPPAEAMRYRTGDATRGGNLDTQHPVVASSDALGNGNVEHRQAHPSRREADRSDRNHRRGSVGR